MDLYEDFSETPSLFGLCEHFFAVDLFDREVLDSDRFLRSFLRGNLGRLAEDGWRALLRLRDQLIPQFLEESCRDLLRREADIYGFTCTFHQVMASLAISRRIKELNPNAIILLGGACVHGAMGETYARAFPSLVDHVFTGEADESFLDFLQVFAEGIGVIDLPGVTVGGVLRKKATLMMNLAELPTPNYDDYFLERDRLISLGYDVSSVKNLPYESSRGCWWGEKSHCTFCGLNNEGMRYRVKPSKKVTAELVRLSERYGAISFMAADNILDHRGYQDLLSEIEQLGLDFRLFYEIKANISRRQVAALARAGVLWVQPGIESFSDHVLVRMRKGTTALRNVQLLKWLAEYGIQPSYNILVGFDGEKDEDYVEQIALLPRLFHLPPPSGTSTLVQVHRFSPFFLQPEEFGIQNMRAESFYRHLIPENLVRPEEVAYFFEREIPSDAPIWRHRDGLDSVLRQWVSSNKRITARLGAGVLEVSIVEGERAISRAFHGAKAVLLIGADSQIPYDLLVQRVESRLGLSRNSIDDSLRALIQEGLIIEHKGNILSLVPFEKPHSEEVLSAWIDRWWQSGAPFVEIASSRERVYHAGPLRVLSTFANNSQRLGEV